MESGILFQWRFFLGRVWWVRILGFFVELLFNFAYTTLVAHTRDGAFGLAQQLDWTDRGPGREASGESPSNPYQNHNLV